MRPEQTKALERHKLIGEIVATLTGSPVQPQSRGGRPLTLYACPHCMGVYGSRALAEHVPRCPARYPLCLRKPTRHERLLRAIRIRSERDQSRIANYLHAELPGATGAD